MQEQQDSVARPGTSRGVNCEKALVTREEVGRKIERLRAATGRALNGAQELETSRDSILSEILEGMRSLQNRMSWKLENPTTLGKAAAT